MRRTNTTRAIHACVCAVISTALPRRWWRVPALTHPAFRALAHLCLENRGKGPTPNHMIVELRFGSVC